MAKFESCSAIGQPARKKKPAGAGFRGRAGTYSFTLRAVAMVFLRSRLKKARSDGVSILGTKEIAGFALGEPVKGVAKGFFPPGFEFKSMFLSEEL